MKRNLLLLLCAVFTTVTIAQPANNECLTADPIATDDLDNGNGSCGNNIAGTTVGATTWDISGLNFTGNCWNGIDTLNVVFYTFDAQGVSGSVEVLNGPDDYFISVIEFTAGACDGSNISELGCSANTPILFDNDLTVTTTYYVIVAFANNTEGTFDLCVFNPVPADNDECIDAYILPDIDGSCNAIAVNNYYYPSSEAQVPACFPAGATQSVWFKFTAQGVSIADLHIEGAPDVANVAVWDFDGVTTCDLATGVLLGCQANADGNNPIVLDNLLTIGNEYYIEVTFDNNATGAFDVCLDAPEQAFNDDCIDAVMFPTLDLDDENSCLTNIGGDNLNNDWPSSDVLAPACWDANFSYSVWFQFEAQGPDVDITVTSTFGEDEQVALVQFQAGGTCDVGSAIVIECSTGADLEVDNILDVGATYYVMVGFDNNEIGDYCINIFNPTPPDNDTVCAAVALVTDGSCNSGPPCINDCYTTEYANPEFDPNSFPAECQAFVENSVWFTAQLMDPNNVGLEITIDEGTGENFTVVVGTFDDCTGQFFVEAFFCDFNSPYEFGPVFDETQVYYIMVSSAEDDEGTFTICVDEIEPCFENNYCEDLVGTSNAEEILGVVTDQGFICIEGCNLWADINTESTACQQNQGPTVWYTLTVDADAADINIIVESDDMGAPTINLYVGTCNGGLTIVPVNDGQSCANGSGGQAIANTQVVPGETYYISVSGINTEGGDFEICVNTLFDASACVLNSDQEITYRSLGGPIEGPYFPGEEVTLCFNLNQYTPVGNGCQWFQGIVPIFGNGWDLDNFDPVGGATLNGANYPAPGVYGGTWNWYDDIHYNSNIAFYQLGDFDGNGTLDMCNSNFDPDCVGPGITGGMISGSCNIGGDVLPPGWFVSFPVDGCPQSGHPDDDWGDGSGCGSTMGPWEFCMDMTVKSYPECDEDETSSDLTVTFFTFADGETGAWTGGPSTCAADQPETFIYPMCCVETEILVDHLDPFCTPGTFVYTLDNPNVEFWEWVVNFPGTIVGPTDGSGANGTTVINTIVNEGTTEEIVTYNFLGFQGGECPAVILTVDVIVYPDIMVELTPFTVCATPFDPYSLTPMVSGGDASSYMYEWFDGSTDATLLIDAPVAGQAYTVTVTDGIGCSGTATVVLDVYETFPVEIDAPVLGQCLSDGPITINASADGGMPAYVFEWTTPAGGLESGSGITTTEQGQWVVTATDSEGCVGKDSVTLDFWDSPTVTLSPENPAVCPNDPNPQQIIAIVSGGEPPYEYLWSLPDGSAPSTSFIFADVIGAYNLIVTDKNGCVATLDFNVEAAESPEVDLGPDVTLCQETLDLGYELLVPFDPSYQFYQWSNSSLTPSISPTEPGTYTVTVTNNGGCASTAQITIDVHDPVPDLFVDTVTFCENGTADIEGPPSFDYVWSNGSTSSLIIVSETELIFVEITDANGCVSEEEIEIIESSSLNPGLTGDNVICNNVAVDISATTYEIMDWYSNSELTDVIASDVSTITATTEGWYFVVVSDGDGCFGVDSIFITETEPDPIVTGVPAICDNESSTLNVGAWDAISWSTGETTEMITTDTAGIFFVTVTDQYGCSNSAQFDVIESAAPDPQIAGSTSFCIGNSTILDAGGPYDVYEWSTGEASQTISVNTTSTLYLTVTNAAGCFGYDTINVVESTALTPQIQGDNVVCNSVPVDLDAGTGFVSYEWSTSESTQIISVSGSGTYIVTVTDASGCTGTDEMVIQSGAPTPVINGNVDACEGGAETIAADAGYATYEWSTTESTSSIDVNATGTYTVTVTDQLGCTGTASFDFTINANPTPNIAGSTTFCVGSSTQLDAGAGYVTYVWSGGQTGQNVTISSPGTQTVTVTDANGCTGTADITITESTELVLNVQDTTVCNGDVVTLIVGTFDTYVWESGETTPTIDVTAGGTYTVTVSDASGCTGSASIAVTENQPPFATVTNSASACNTIADGSKIDFSTLVTAGDFTGTWRDVDNSGATGTFPDLDFDGVATGQYQFEYTTSSAVGTCVEQTYPVTITIQDCACPSPLIGIPADICSDNGVLDLTTLILGSTQTGGSWTLVTTPGGSNPATLNGSMFDATDADPGMYEIQYMITGIPAGCPDTDLKQILVNEPVDAGLATQPAQVCVDEDSTITLANLITGAQAGGIWVETSVVLSTGGFDDISGAFFTMLEIPGTYTFEYILAGTAPCGDARVTVEVVIEDVPDAQAGSDMIITCDEPTAELDGTGSSQGGSFVYNWRLNGVIVGTGISLPNVNDEGTYELEVINTATGCISYDYVDVSVDGDIPVMATSLRVPVCVGDNPATVTVTGVTGGSAPYSYTLNGGNQNTTGFYSDLAPGDYSLVVVDANGCSDRFDFTVNPETSVDGRVVGDVVIELGDEVVLTIELFVGVADSIVWTDADGNPICTNCDTLVLEATENMDLFVTIYDVNGCSVTLPVSLFVSIDRQVFVPNVFTPNGDGVNDYVTVYGPEGTKIHKFEVFSRWGELVFSSDEDIDAGVSSLGWDGKFAGKELQPGVFVYHAQVIYPGDDEEIIKGDITLIR